MATNAGTFPRGRYVILHIRAGPPYPDPSTTPQIAADARFELSDDIWIERLDKDSAINVQQACEPANFGIDNFVHDRHLYAFIRAIPQNETTRNAGLLDLLTVIVLSRFIRPTSTGERYCANVFRFSQPGSPILALPLAGSPDVFLGDNSQDWLSPADGVELRKMMPWVSGTKLMHPRVHRAYWNHEQAMRTYFLDMRWNLVVSGLEALITVEDRSVRRQFVRRVGQLAAECG